MNNVETTSVLLAVSDDTNTAHVATTGDHGEVAGVKLDKVGDFVLLEVKLDGVVDLDERVGVADCSAVVGDDVGHTAGAKRDLADLEELVRRLFGGDAVDGEAALDVVQEAEELAGFFDGDDICNALLRWIQESWFKGKRTHESSRVGRVSANFAVDLDQALHDDSSHLASSQGIL